MTETANTPARRARANQALRLVASILTVALVAPVAAIATPTTASAESPPGTSGAWVSERISVGPSGQPGDGDSDDPSISADGSSVVFRTDATNLTPVPSMSSTIVLRDLASGLNEVVSLSSTGSTLSFPRDPDVSGDAGRVIMSRSSGGERAITYFDRNVAQATDVGPGIGLSSPEISAAGDRAVFVQADTNDFDNDKRQYVWFHDERTGQSDRIVSDLPGLNDEASRPVISDDGNVIAYTYRIGNGRGVRVHDVTDGTIGAAEDYPAVSAALSADGRFLVTLRNSPETGNPIVHRHDRLTGEGVQVVELPGLASNLDVSADGNVVVYSTSYFDDANEYRTEIRVTDVVTGQTDAIAVVDPSPDVDLSADGTFVAFATSFALDPADTNNASDVYVARRADTGAPTWSLGAALAVEQVSSTLVALRWSAATDDTAVAGYRLTRDGELVAELPAGTLTYTATGLTPETEYRFELVAFDAEGNVSTPLVRDVYTNSQGEPGSAILSATAGPGGSVFLQWDPAPDADGYRIMRTDGFGMPLVVAEVDAATTELRDSGLAADTEYGYAVEALYGTDYFLHTVVAYATTPSVEISTVNWSGRGQIGTEATIVIKGAPSWVGAADVHYMTWYAPDGELLSAPRAATATVEAVEDPAAPGTYHADFPIVDGIAQITRVVGVLSDGHGAGATAAVHRTLNVLGALYVTIDAPARSIEGARLVVPNLAQVPVSGGEVSTFAAVPAGDHAVRIQSAGGQLLAHGDVTVTNGLEAEVTVTPDLPAFVTTRVVDPDGDPIAGAKVTLRRGASVLNVAVSDSDGRAPVGLELLADATLAVVVEPPIGDNYLGASRSITLEGGDNFAEVTLQPIVRAPITGTITLSDGTPARGANVIVNQVVGGSRRSATATTDDEGHYSLTAVVGEANVTVQYRNNPNRSQLIEVTVPSTRFDTVVPVPDDYTLDISLYTRELGGAWHGPLDIDWRTAAHYRMRIEGAGTSAGITDSTKVNARPGDEIRVCADGREVGYTSPCTSVTLGSERNVPVEVRLESAARIEGRLVTPAGGPTDRARVQVNKVQPNGSLATVFSYRPTAGGEFSINIADPGQYRIHASDTGPMAGGPSWTASRTLDVELVEGQVLDLDDLVLATTQWAKESSVTANRSTVVPGGEVEVRAHIVPPTTLTGVGAEFTVPAGMRVVDGSVLLGGEPVDATVDDSFLVVDLPEAGRADGWVVRYRLQDIGAEAGTKVVSAATVVLPDGREEPVGSVTLRVAAVTLEAPRHSASRHVVLSGWAPPGAAVSVFDGRQLAGESVASPGGLWTLSAVLPELGNGRTHTLQASVELGGTTLMSEPLRVLVDNRLPELERVTLSRNGDYSASFDPRHGVARFPFVWAGSTMTVTAQFSDRGSVAEVRASIGAYSAPAVQISDRQWEATMVTGPYGLGGIDIDFVAYPEVGTLSSEPKPTVEEVRGQLPPGFDQFGEPQVTVDESTPTRRSATITTPMPAFGDDASIRSTMTVDRDVEYTISASDLAAVRETGVEIYGFRMNQSFSPGRDRLTVNTTFYVPVDQLDGESVMGISSAAPQAAGVLAKITLNEVFTGVQLIDNANTAAGTGDKYDRLNQLLNRVQRNCDALNTDLITGRLEGVAAMALAADAMKISLMLVGTLLAPATLGVGTLVVWGATYAAGHLIDYKINKELDELSQEISAECEDDEDDDEDPDDPENPDDPGTPDDDSDDSDSDDSDSDDDLAVPEWIYDPSGYVFEAVPSNRLQGVTATVTYSPTPDGEFVPWDAEWYGQNNPLVTDDQGRYGWDVPLGFWQVGYAKDGYAPGASEVLEVLPPHFDVNVGLVSYATPDVVAAAATPGDGVGVTFSKYMDLGIVDDELIAVSDADGEMVAGTIEAVDAEDGPAGRFARTFQFVPAAPFADGQLVTVTVDAAASSYAGTPMADAYTAELTVAEPEPTPPSANADLVATDEDVAVVVDVLANDESTSGAVLEIGELGRPAHGTVTPVDGMLRYAPAADFHGVDRFTYVAVDGSVASEPTTVTVHVLPRNDAPRASAVTATVAEGQSVVLDLVSSGSDVDGDVLSVHATEQPEHGDVEVAEDGSVTYTPDASFTGQDTFRYRVTDGDRISAWAIVTITVTQVNQAPVAVADSATTASGVAVTIDVTANDSDPDGDPLTVAIVGNPAKGSVKVGDDQRVTYTPAAGFSGTDSFTYRVSDPAGMTSAVATVTITVTQVNRAPVAVADSATTASGVAVTIDVTANDSDPDGDPLTVAIVGNPAKGSVKVGDDQRVTYTPAAGFSGTDSFTYRVSDPAGLMSAVATVTITVTPPPSGEPVCTITGTGGSDILIGTSGPDVICGLGGADVLVGNGGDDILIGGDGIDILDGGAGNDRIEGGAGADVISGGAGDDFLIGGDGIDILDGGAGNDRIEGGAGADVISGGAGDDILIGGDGIDILDGGAGNDRIEGGAGADVISGGAGDDLLDGGDGIDAIDGGAGRDGWKSGDLAVAVRTEYRY